MLRVWIRATECKICKTHDSTPTNTHKMRGGLSKGEGERQANANLSKQKGGGGANTRTSPTANADRGRTAPILEGKTYKNRSQRRLREEPNADSSRTSPTANSDRGRATLTLGEVKGGRGKKGEAGRGLARRPGKAP